MQRKSCFGTICFSTLLRRAVTGFVALLPVLGVAGACASGNGMVMESASAETTRAHAAKARRVVSLNLCVDQYLLALADRGQIAGLTINANNADMSAAADQTRGLPLLRFSAEEILAANPDLVIGMPARGTVIMNALASRRYAMLDLPYAESYGDIVTQIRTVSAALGHPERGERLIAQMNRDLATINRPGRKRIAAYYQRRGYLTGTGTLVDDMMQRVGLVNLAAKLGKPALSRLSLEEMVAAQPDFIIVETATGRISDQGTEMLHHPALRSIPRIAVPEAWTVCGGPAYIKAVRSMAAQIDRQHNRQQSSR